MKNKLFNYSLAMFIALFIIPIHSIKAEDKGFWDFIDDVLKHSDSLNANITEGVALKLDFESIKNSVYPSLSLSANIGREKNSPELLDSTTFNEKDFIATIKQNIYNGGALDANVDLKQIAIWTNDSNYANIVNNTALNASKNYIALLKYQELVANNEKYTKLLDDLSNKIKQQVEIDSGLASLLTASKNYILQLELKGAAAKNELNINKLNFFELAGYSFDGVNLQEPPKNNFSFDLEQTYAQAETDNPQIKTAALTIASATAKNKVDTARLLPTIDAVVEGEYSDNLDGAAGYKKTLSANLKMNYNFSFSDSKRNKAAGIRVKVAEYNYKAAIKNIRNQVSSNHTRYTLQVKLYDIYKQQLDVANKVVIDTKEQIKTGDKSLNDLFGALRDQEANETKVITNNYDTILYGYGVFHNIGGFSKVVLDN